MGKNFDRDLNPDLLSERETRVSSSDDVDLSRFMRERRVRRWGKSRPYNATIHILLGSTTHHPANLARACPSLKKIFESSPTLLLTVCKVASLNLKSKSFRRSMCKTDFHLFFCVFADSGFTGKIAKSRFVLYFLLISSDYHQTW